jgi:hypothetical protein
MLFILSPLYIDPIIVGFLKFALIKKKKSRVKWEWIGAISINIIGHIHI